MVDDALGWLSWSTARLLIERKRARDAGDWDKGVAYASELVYRDDNFANLCWLAWFRREQGKFDLALEYINRALILNRHESQALTFRDDVKKRLFEEASGGA